jgi:hypothetical protein
MLSRSLIVCSHYCHKYLCSARSCASHRLLNDNLIRIIIRHPHSQSLDFAGSNTRTFLFPLCVKIVLVIHFCRRARRNQHGRHLPNHIEIMNLCLHESTGPSPKYQSQPHTACPPTSAGLCSIQNRQIPAGSPSMHNFTSLGIFSTHLVMGGC